MNPKIRMALAIGALFAAPALAQQAGSTTEPQDSNPAAPPAAPAPDSAAGATAGSAAFSTIDRNTDGYVSRDEAREQSWNSRFSELDRDNDGRLSEAEYNTLSADADSAAGATREERK